MPRWSHLLRRFRANDRGTLIAEFAASLPMLLLLVMGGTEISRYVICYQKLDRVTTAIGDLVSQEEDITTSKLNDIFSAVGPIVSPFSFGANGMMIVSSITSPDNGTTKTVAWQRTGAGTLLATSKVGAQGGNATLPSGMVIRTNETIIVSESFYRFEPIFMPSWFNNNLGEQTIYHSAYYRPRFGALTTIN